MPFRAIATPKSLAECLPKNHSNFPASISKIAAGLAKFLLESQIPAFSVARSIRP
jgi:hypothetical protein